MMFHAFQEILTHSQAYTSMAMLDEFKSIVWVLRILSTAAFAKDLIFGSDPWIWHAGFEFMPDGRFGYVRHPPGMPDS